MAKVDWKQNPKPRLGVWYRVHSVVTDVEAIDPNNEKLDEPTEDIPEDTLRLVTTIQAQLPPTLVIITEA
eukprot:1671494-Amphidinium_carterae.1